MNKFCISQAVIHVTTRNMRQITDIYSNGKLVLDEHLIVHPESVQVLEDYRDPTNFFYHHTRFGNAISLMNEGFYAYRSALDELQDLASYPGESVFLMKARNYCQEELATASAKIEKGLAMKRCAENNMAQWDGKTLDFHFPFINLENISEY